MKRGAVIGCGFFAQNHLNAWKIIDGVEIVAVCDSDELKAKNCAEEFGIANYYRDAETMLKLEQLDFVDIVTQAHTHLALTTLVAKYGVNTICQKPLAPSLKEAQQIVKATKNIIFMVHENFRWQQPMLELQKASENLGKLFFGRIQFRSGYNIYAEQPYLATEPRFILYDLGVHLFDLARFFFGEAKTLSCHTQRVNLGIAAEDVATALLKMQTGANVVVDMSYASKLEQETFPQTLVLLEGEKGSARLDINYQLSVTLGGTTKYIDMMPQKVAGISAATSAIPESVLTIQRHFIECLETGKTPNTSGTDNLRTLELTFGAYRSAEAGQTIKLGER